MGATDIILDQAVRNWVFIPLTLCIVLMKLLTQYAHTLANLGGGGAAKEPKEIREQQAVARSQRLRAMHRWLPESAFKMRREFFAAKDTGFFWQKSQSRSMQEAMATDPSIMVDMMKKQLTGIVPQLAMGMVVNFFFQGFVLGKIPFALSPRFRPMLQRGVDLATLDVSYFTSLSYYVLLLFGLRGVFTLIFRDDAVDESAMMQRQMNPMQNATFDGEAAFKAERTALTQMDHEWELETAEERAVEVLKRASTSKARR